MQIDEQAIYRVVNWQIRPMAVESDPIGNIRQIVPSDTLRFLITLEHPLTGETATITLQQEHTP